MREDLEKLEQILIKAGVDVTLLFNPGIERATIVELVNEIGLHPNEELIQLFQWHNGVNFHDKPTGRISFTNWGVFLPLSYCIDAYKAQIALYNDYFFLFPFFFDDTVMIDLDITSNTYGQLYFLCPSLQIIEPITAYDSLLSMVQTTLNCFEKGLMYYDSEGFLEIDTSAVSTLSKELNPKSEYWNHE